MPRRGPVVYPPEAWRGADTNESIRRVVDWCKGRNVAQIKVDTGYNPGVADGLRLKIGDQVGVYDVEFGGKAYDDERFLNRRAEMWWDFAEEAEKGWLDLTRLGQ